MLFGFSLPTFLASSTFLKIVTYLKTVFDFVFIMALLYAISCIAKDTEVEKTYKAAIRNMKIYAFFFMVILLNESLPSDNVIAKFVFVIALCTKLLVLVLNGTVIFSCYMRICDEGDTEMPRKESRFEFVNNFYKEFDRREQKARKETREMREEMLKKRADRKKRKNK